MPADVAEVAVCNVTWYDCSRWLRGLLPQAACSMLASRGVGRTCSSISSNSSRQAGGAGLGGAALYAALHNALTSTHKHRAS